MKKDANIIESGAMRVVKDYVSRDDLTAMAVNQAVEFVVPSDKFESAKSTCNAMRLKGKKFSTKIAPDQLLLND